MKTSIIILTYNKLEYNKLCIESIKQNTESSTYEIIVVDNGSTDGTREWLTQQDNVKTIFNETNMGFPKGCNQGIEISIGENILLLNNDTIVTHNWLDNLVRCLYSSDDIGAVGPVTNNSSYYQTIPVNYESIEEMHTFAKKYNVQDPDKWEERLKLIGYSVLFKREVFEKIGYLDERFTPGNFEDDDYSLRIRKEGYRLFLCRDTFIHHFGSTSFRDNASSFLKLLETNENKFIEKWGFSPSTSALIHQGLIEFMDTPKENELTVLHIGCTCGGTLLKIKHEYRNAKLFGLESDIYASKEAISFAQINVGNIEDQEIQYPDNFFDYIILTNVLENSKDPQQVLSKVKLFLKPEGKILARIPNLMHYSKVRNLRGYWEAHRDQLSFFTLFEIERIFKETGFQDLFFTGITIPISDDDKIIIERLSKIVDPHLSNQLEITHFLVTAKLNDCTSSIKQALINIQTETQAEKSLKILNQFEIQKIVAVVISEMTEKVNLLNLLAIKYFAVQQYDRVIPYLSAAEELDLNCSTTLFNLGYVLNLVGEKQLAKSYLERIENSDEEVVNLLHQIRQELDNNRLYSTELKYALRRIENQIETDESITLVGQMINDRVIMIEQLIEQIKEETIQKDNLLNLLAVNFYQEGNHDNILPLLQCSLEINPTNHDTLFNLGYILYNFGEHELALEYLLEIPDKDVEVEQLIFDIREAVK
ncbi:MAG: glycosyltransferase [Bacteroidetes bacterium]|nr:glycosyltransferase [Bacteroidota bacterium]